MSELIKTITAYSPEETEKAGADFSSLLKTKDFVALKGDLGAGKTTFVRGIASVICPGSRVQSPTYTVVNEYRGNIPLFHFDMYRITDEDSLYGIGFYDYLKRDGISVCEWSEKIEEYLPENRYVVEIDRTEDNNGRIIKIYR